MVFCRILENNSFIFPRGAQIFLQDEFDRFTRAGDPRIDLKADGLPWGRRGGQSVGAALAPTDCPSRRLLPYGRRAAPRHVNPS